MYRRVEFTFSYGGNAHTVRSLEIMATDYDRSMEDSWQVDQLLFDLLAQKANAVGGSGAPTL